MATSELASTYAALILADEGLEITADKIVAIASAANVEVEPIWASLLAKALEGKDVKELLTNVGAGGAAPAAGAAPGAAAGGAAEEAKEEAKEEDKEESDDDMGCVLAFFSSSGGGRPRRLERRRRRLCRERSLTACPHLVPPVCSQHSFLDSPRHHALSVPAAPSSHRPVPRRDSLRPTCPRPPTSRSLASPLPPRIHPRSRAPPSSTQLRTLRRASDSPLWEDFLRPPC
ncbi:60s acidic ribosomal protein-domain-containing protein [Rhodotorula diobovata]|uniref:60s acidic ribosomal protein-domain-containing protein n=1 Tax=Rhodotorula diobovata TaxID=5288 RepID=A0A5C5G586_9BASI|nr:60s acidic ribosomal protein-domain-containing protein [Rhodotorula diobovata]